MPSFVPSRARLEVEDLEARHVPSGTLLSAARPGEDGVVRVVDFPSGATRAEIAAFPGYMGGLFAAASRERTADGTPERIAVGTRSGPPHVKVFDGATGALLQSFYAYDPAYRGGVEVAFGDVNRDGTPDVITGTAAGTSHVKVFDGRTGAEVRSFLAFGGGYAGGVTVGGGDIDRDGTDDVIVGTAAGTSHVKVFDGQSGGLLRSFLAFPGFAGGVRVAGGDLDHDGQDDIVVGAGPGAAHVVVFRGSDLAVTQSWVPFAPPYAGGVSVGVEDLNGDGLDDLAAEQVSGEMRFSVRQDPAEAVPVQVS